MSDPPSDAAAGAPPPGAKRSLRTSVLAGVVLAVLAGALLAAGPWPFFALALAVVLAAQYELYAALRSRGHTPAVVVGLVSGAVMLTGAFVRGPLALGLLVALPLPLLVAWALTVPPEHAGDTVASTYLGLAYVPLLASFLVMLLPLDHGRVIALAVVGIPSVQDAGAYLVGRRFGRRRMAPVTSPGKSWEGLLAGTALAVGASVATLPLLEPFDVSLAARFAAVLCVAAPLGDLAESAIKRDLGLKDMGTLIPGHGGVLDRVDAMLFAAPAAYFVLEVLRWS